MGCWSLRALVLTSGLLLLDGCGVRTELLDPGLPPALPTDDGGVDTYTPVDRAESDAEADETDAVERPPLGTCSFDDQSLLCLPGDVCHANFVVGPSPFICGPSGDPSTPCGLIGCGAGCACVDATSSACRCQ
jgi:hypothetical protein